MLMAAPVMRSSRACSRGVTVSGGTGVGKLAVNQAARVALGAAGRGEGGQDGHGAAVHGVASWVQLANVAEVIVHP